MTHVGISSAEVALPNYDQLLTEFLTDLKQQGYDGSEEDATKQFAHQVAELYKNQGNEYLKNSKYDVAVDLYKAAIELSPSAIYYSNLAAAYFNAKDYSECLSACYTGIKLDPTFAKTHFRLARCQRQLNEFEEALKSYEKSLELDPKDANVKKARDQLVEEMKQRETM